MRSRRPPATAVATMVVVMLALSLLSACGGLPTASSVQQGSLVGEAALQPVRVQPDGPEAGATQEQIVRGFLRAGAGAGFDDDHATARSFFVRKVRDSWRPDSGVKVYDDRSALKVVLLTPRVVRVSAVVVAEVDGAGRYRQTPAGTVAQATFGMQRLGEGWRISEPPRGVGLWLSATEMERSYRSFTVAYVSRVAHRMVVDRRWFPITPGLATTLARAQLAPVPSYLRGAALTGVPAGTTLGVDSVPVQSGTAVVSLSASALLASPELRRAMWAQFVTTLSQVTSVSEVSIQVGGAGLDLPDTPSAVSSLTTLGYLPQTSGSDSIDTAILRNGSVLTRVFSDRPPDRDRPNLPANSSLPGIAPGWVSLALSWDGREIAAIGGDQGDLARWQGNRLFRQAKFATNLTRPSYDSLEGLWVAGDNGGGSSRVWVIDTSVSPLDKAAGPRAIPVPWLANRKVLAMKVASDNQRVALVTSDRAGRDVQVLVAGIVRSADGKPVSLAAEPLRVGWTLTAATDLAWVDDSTLAVVGRVGQAGDGNLIGPQLVEIGGRVTAMPPVPGTRLVTNTGGLRGVVVLTDGGKILARAGSGWQVLQTGTDFLIPGE